MRGEKRSQEELFHYFSVEERVPSDHPLRGIRALCDKVLKSMSDTFDTMYSDVGRPSIAPEVLLKSTVLMALYSIRSERQFCEQLNYNILFRWFLGMDMSQGVFERSVFSKNRARLIEHEVSREFFAEVVKEARARKLVSEEHFTVDGTLIESWASLKSFVSKDKQDRDDSNDGNGFKPSNPEVNFHGERRTNETHASLTDPEALLIKKGKGKEARLAFCASAVTENRNGLVVDCDVSLATGTAEVQTAVSMLNRMVEDASFAVKTVGADKGYHQRDFVSSLRGRGIVPHVACIKGRNVPGLDRRTTARDSYKLSQKKRKLIEQCFGFLKTVGGVRKSRLVGCSRTNFLTQMTFATLNILRITRLSTA